MSDAVRTVGALLPTLRRPRDANAATTADGVAVQWAASAAWSPRGGAIARRGRSRHDFETGGFARAQASRVPRQGDDADLKVGDEPRDVCLSTRSAAGTTGHDVICAAQAEAMFTQRYGGAA
jgi:pterin-4a-carbinolamine dehydratase